MFRPCIHPQAAQDPDAEGMTPSRRQTGCVRCLCRNDGGEKLKAQI